VPLVAIILFEYENHDRGYFYSYSTHELRIRTVVRGQYEMVHGYQLGYAHITNDRVFDNTTYRYRRFYFRVYFRRKSPCNKTGTCLVIVLLSRPSGSTHTRTLSLDLTSTGGRGHWFDWVSAFGKRRKSGFVLFSTCTHVNVVHGSTCL